MNLFIMFWCLLLNPVCGEIADMTITYCHLESKHLGLLSLSMCTQSELALTFFLSLRSIYSKWYRRSTKLSISSVDLWEKSLNVENYCFWIISKVHNSRLSLFLSNYHG